MTGVCRHCGRRFVTTFTLPTDECDACFNAQYDTGAAVFVGPDIRQMRRDEQAASDAFDNEMLTLNYQIESVAW